MQTYFHTPILMFTAFSALILCGQAQAQRTTSYTYNSFGQVLTMDGPRTDVSDVTTYEYDPQGNRTKMINALSQETLYTSYDASGYLLSMTDPNGVITDYTYDLRQRMTSYTVAVGTGLAATTTLEYDLVGNLTAVIQPNGARIDYEYDAAHRLVAMEDGLGNRMEYTLDLAGNITQQDLRDPFGTLASTQTMVYDELSRLIETVGADTQTMGYEYDSNDNLVEVEDGFLNPTSRTVDALNRVVQETDRDLNTASFTYDSEDRLTSVTDQRGLTTTYTYNAYGDLIEQDSPDTGITTFTYDNASNLTQRTDARGEVSSYTYDALNRLLTLSYPSDTTENVTYTYDQGTNGIGRLTQIQDDSGQTDYAYNVLGQLTTKIIELAGITYSLGYDYDLSGNLTQITYPSGRLLDFGLDALGRIDTISTRENAAATAEAVVQSVSYLPFGPAESFTYGNGISQTMGYDQDYRVSTIVSQGSNGILDRFYQYDFNNNIIDILDYEDNTKDQDFTYDILDRLTSADGAYGIIDYDYDPVGNRTQRVIDDGTSIVTEDYTYSATANQLDQITGSPGGTRDFVYDQAGNQLSGENPDGDSLSHSYNAANRPEQATGPNGNAYYTHNALGQRVIIETDVPAEEEHLHYDEQGNLIAITDNTGITQREYLYLGTQKIALLVEDAISNTAPVVTISSPSESAVFLDTDTVSLIATATDIEDGDISSNLAWSSNIDGSLGTGSNLIINLSLGVHTITADVTDSGSSSDSQTVNVTVNASGGAGFVDADLDGMDDAWEVLNGLNPNDASDRLLDADADGFSNYLEHQAGTDPSSGGDTPNYRYYVLNAAQAGYSLEVMSLADNNQVTMGATALTLQNGEIGTIPGNDVTQGGLLEATSAISVGSTRNNTDMPISEFMAGTSFAVPHNRNNHLYYLMSPSGDATVDIEVNGVTNTLNLIQGVVTLHNAGNSNSTGSIVTSDMPILVTHAGASGSTPNRDVYPVPPASTDLWGDRRGGKIAIMEDSTSVTVYASGGASATYTGDKGDRINISTGNNGTEGSSDMVHLVADKPIAAVEYADSDGSETAAYFDRAYFARTYGLPVNTQYVQVACAANTDVRFYNPGSTIPDATQSCISDGQTPGRVNFGSTSDGANLSAGSMIEADEPIYLMYEVSSTNDEHNLMGAQ